jgi:biopolymer transport protein ExbB/TolQ
MSNSTNTDLLADPAIDIFVSVGIVLLLAGLARIALQLVLPEGAGALKIKLEVVLCKQREGSAPITVNAGEVVLAYAATAFTLLVAIASIVIFFVGLGNMSHNVADGLSLFSSLGQGHGMGIAALIVWLLSLMTAISLSLRSWNIARETFLNPEFVKLLGEHLQKTKQTGCFGRLLAPMRKRREKLEKKYGKPTTVFERFAARNAEQAEAEEDAHLPMLALPTVTV